MSHRKKKLQCQIKMFHIETYLLGSLRIILIQSASPIWILHENKLIDPISTCSPGNHFPFLFAWLIYGANLINKYNIRFPLYVPSLFVKCCLEYFLAWSQQWFFLLMVVASKVHTRKKGIKNSRQLMYRKQFWNKQVIVWKK